ncbi:MAG TPA: FAD-dependent oxidoreductase, partial [Candidatus Omnitrophota bacterium]|nr:FAD-dependent oxidoreductase [Candidatus Omnitrophota bacterium]
GIGITPIRSIFKYVTDAKVDSSMVLLYSSQTPEYLIFRSDFSEMQKTNHNLKIVYTLTGCKEEVEGCRIGYINDLLIKDEIPDYKDRIFFICGPPGMVAAMKSILMDKLALSQTQIVTEDFLGY